jgi:alkylation response protein AidB-like acyl-CoA dehydrogenase
MLATTPPYLASLDQVIDEVIAPAAVEIDRTSAFPRAALDALGKAGLLGCIWPGLSCWVCTA